MEKSIYKYILQHTKPDQLKLMFLTVVSLPFLYASLEIPKIIINKAIGGRDFPQDILGYEFQQIPFLLMLCVAFMVLVIINGVLKYVINVYRGVVGERMLRRFRFELYQRIQRFPLPHFKRTSQGEIIPMITAETEPLGGFIGDSFALPAFQGGVLITLLFFIFNQDLLLGLAAIALYPPQMYVIPKLQRKVNLLAKQRVQTVRKLSDKVGESVAGMGETHANDATHFERADISGRLARIYDIRFEIYRRKFFIKFLNNFLAQLTPFFFYSIGGYFVITGELSLGALVAVLAAYKDISAPWKELLKYYQIKEDIRIKYGQIIEQFNPANMFRQELLDDTPTKIEPLQGKLVSSNVSYTEDEFVKALDGANFQFDFSQHVAVVGSGASGKDELGRLVARLLLPSRGRIVVDKLDLAKLPEAVTGQRTAYVGQNAYIFSGTIMENLFYGLKHRVQPTEYSKEEQKQREIFIQNAVASGNSSDDYTANWIDFESAGVDDMDELVKRAIEVLEVVELDSEIYNLGLRGTVDPNLQPALVERVMQGRMALKDRLQDKSIAPLVELINVEHYNTNMTVAENLLFGTPEDPSLHANNLASHPVVLSVLQDHGLDMEFLRIGYQMAEIMVDIFADVSPDSDLFEQFAFFSADDLPVFQGMLKQGDQDKLEELSPDNQRMFSALAFLLAPARHRLGLIDEPMQEKVLAARYQLMGLLEAEKAPVVFFNAEQYNPTISIQDNILFGRLAYGQALGQAKVGELIAETVDRLDLRSDIIRAGFEYQVGIAGARLSSAQRQKLAFARCLLKQPDLLISNEATAGLDPGAANKLFNKLKTTMQGRGLLWISSHLDLLPQFDRILVLEHGKVVEQGTYDELKDKGGALTALFAAEAL